MIVLLTVFIAVALAQFDIVDVEQAAAALPNTLTEQEIYLRRLDDEARAQCLKDAAENTSPCTSITYGDNCVYALDVECIVIRKCREMAENIEGGCITFEGINENTGACIYSKSLKCVREKQAPTVLHTLERWGSWLAAALSKAK